MDADVWKLVLGAAAAAGAGLAAFARWAIKLWEQLRRDEIIAAKETAAAARADNARVMDALITGLQRVADSVDGHTKTDLAHHATVTEAIVRVDAKLDAWARRRTPTELRVTTDSERRKKEG